MDKSVPSFHTNLVSPEFLLLFTLLHTQISKEEFLSIKRLTHADWERIITLAYRLQVGALLYHRVIAFALQSLIPTNLLDKIHAIYRQTAVQNLRNYSEIEAIVTVFAKQGIPVILLKGAYLAYYVYDSIALRPMSDVDLLVPENHRVGVNELLEKLGYQPVEKRFANDLRVTTWKKANVLNLEIHWAITNSDYFFHVDISDWWLRAQSVKLGQTQALVFCPEDLLLHLCIHASYHHLFELSTRFVCDIAQVIEHFQAILDWHAFVYRTKQLGLESGTYITLVLTQEWMNIAIPEHVLTALLPRSPDSQLFVQIKYWLSQSNESAYNSISRNVSTFVYSPSFLQKIKVLICQLFPSPKKLALIYSLSYPSWRVYFYYFVRFKDLWHDHGPIAWRLWRGEASLRNVAQFQNALLDWLQQTDK